MNPQGGQQMNIPACLRFQRLFNRADHLWVFGLRLGRKARDHVAIF
jgi:hypothetical protein